MIVRALALCALRCLSIYISKLLYLLNLLNSHTACHNHLKAINIDKIFHVNNLKKSLRFKKYQK